MKVVDFLKHMKYVTHEDLISIDGIGEVLAENYTKFNSSGRYDKMIKEFERQNDKGLDISLKYTKSSSDGDLNGVRVCITGTFKDSRSAIANGLIVRGAKIVSTVGKNTDILLAGENPGSKVSKAESFDVKIVRNLEDL